MMWIKPKSVGRLWLLLIPLIAASGCSTIVAQERELGEEQTMNIQTLQKSTATTVDATADESAIRAIPLQMVDAWNRGSGDGFAASFTETADFIAFEGTHLKGRQAIAEFHTQIFATEVKGTRLEGEVKFVQFLTPELAVMHAVARVALPGQTQTSPSRDSMQLFVVRKYGDEWRADAMLNARQLKLERQVFLDDFDALPADAQRQVTDLIASFKQQAAQGK